MPGPLVPREVPGLHFPRHFALTLSLAGVADPAGGLRGGRSEAVLAGAPVRGPWGHPHLHAWPGGHRGACLVVTVMGGCVLCVRLQCLMVAVTSGDLRPDCGTSGRTGECARLGRAAHLLPTAFRPPGQNLPEGAAARTSVCPGPSPLGPPEFSQSRREQELLFWQGWGMMLPWVQGVFAT